MRFGELAWWIKHGLFCACFVVHIPSHVCDFLRVTCDLPPGRASGMFRAVWLSWLSLRLRI